MKQPSCADCWVEAQRVNATGGGLTETAYAALLAECPAGHDRTTLPPGAGDPFARARDTGPAGGGV